MKFYRSLGASLGWFTIIAQYYLNVEQFGPVRATITYFGFFTMLGNILVAFAFAAPLFPQFSVSKFFNRPGTRTAVAVYIVVVEVIFYLLLRKVYTPAGLGGVLNILLHYIMPPLYVVDWVLFVPKQSLAYRQIPYWLIFPIAYLAVVLVRGRFDGYYPYPFLDAGKFGYHQISINVAALSLFFIFLGAFFVTVARLQRKIGVDTRLRRA